MRRLWGIRYLTVLKERATRDCPAGIVFQMRDILRHNEK